MAAQAKDKGYFFDLAEILEERGLTASALSEEAGISHRTLKSVLAGKQPVSAYSIAKIVQALNGFRVADREYVFEELFSPHSELSSTVPIASTGESIAGVSALEFAILSLTNSHTWDNNNGEYAFRMLTSKEAYLYLPSILRVAESVDPDFDEELSGFQKSLTRLFFSNIEEIVPSIPSSSFDVSVNSLSDEEFSWKPEESSRVNAALRAAYDKGLIVDPIIEPVGTIAIATLGILPTSFTKRTVDGDVVYRKVSALLWEYEYLNEEEKEQRKLHFRIEKIIEVFKKTIASVHRQINEDQ